MFTISSPLASFFALRAMRRILTTGDPSARSVSDMPRYAILEHDWPKRHWDFLLEAGNVLRAWRLQDEPQTNRPNRAEANFDHRLLYLEYEGPLSGGRGRVSRWDAGTYEW